MNEQPTTPAAPEAERVVLGAILNDPKLATEMVDAALAPEHFHDGANRTVFEAIQQAYYADDPIDPVVIAAENKRRLAKLWMIDEADVVRRVVGLKASPLAQADPRANARLVRAAFNMREILNLANLALMQVQNQHAEPEVIASDISKRAMEIATSTLSTHEILSFEQLGRNWLKHAQRTMVAREQGRELGVWFGKKWVDDFTNGFQPSELMIAGGEPGVGKSAVWWRLVKLFAERQQKFQEARELAGDTEDKRIAAKILSIEMGEVPSSNRMAQSIGGIDGAALRSGRVTREDLTRTAEDWAKQKKIPLYFNHASAMKASQMRALIIEAIKRHNVGLVLIDHFRYFDMDRVPHTANEHDDDKVRFLKQGLAKDLDIAVICIAHTTKSIERADKRPMRSDLRGSGMIAAEADFINFIYRPWKYASDRDREAGKVTRTEAEIIHDKNRHGGESKADFYFNPATMQVT